MTNENIACGVTLMVTLTMTLVMNDEAMTT